MIYFVTSSTVLLRGSTGKTEALGHVSKDVDTRVYTPKELLARTHGENGHVGKRVHTLVIADRECTVEQDAASAVFGVHVVIGGAIGGASRHARTVLVDRPVFTSVRISHQTLEECVTGVPVGGEIAVSVG
jgi:hypothetical protein